MHRRVKLIFSIISLCICLSIGVFGVLAATSVSYSLTNSVSYQIKDVYIRIQAKLYKSASSTTLTQSQMETEAKSLQGKTHSSISGVTLVETYDEFKTYDEANGKIVTVDENAGISCDITYNSTAWAYYIVLEIENYAAAPIHAVLENKTTANDINSYLYLSSITNISEKQTTSVVVGYALKDYTKNTINIPSGIVLTVNEGNI